MQSDQPLYLLSNLSYSIAALELSIRGHGSYAAVADHDHQTTATSTPAAETEEQISAMRRFIGLSERRLAPTPARSVPPC
jgi:hypothetical protein